MRRSQVVGGAALRVVRRRGVVALGDSGSCCRSGSGPAPRAGPDSSPGVVAALVPRSFKQLFLLAFGGGLVYRGLTGNSGLYRAAGIDTAKGALLPQVSAKIKEAAKD